MLLDKQTFSQARLQIPKFVACYCAGLPWSGKNIWKTKFFPGQGKVREFCGWSGKFRKALESQGKVREFENKWMWQEDLRKIYLFCSRGKKMYFLMR